MFNALTLYFTDDEEWQPKICQVTMPDGATKDLNTWAPFLVGDGVYTDFERYSIELRTLIARCMADRGEDRPSLEELLNIIQGNIARGDIAADEAQRKWEEEKAEDPTKQRPPVDVKRPPDVEDNELILRFFREYLREPPTRMDPYEDHWNA
ncbi:hypothetical protein F5Y04DRAFT_256594 [Hypomontagnella monticulosa]|nr:hypothetical protein F5Y04DRAFT_256594 [Hypomontagnella monticulosa]